MNLNKMAQQDAAKWARAEMFFGEGAGTRRKLLGAELSEKQYRIPGYSEAFEDAYATQDMADHAIKAAKERQRLDRSYGVKRNVRGLVTGNKQNLSTGVALAVVTYGILKQTGLDEPIKREVQVRYRQAKVRYNAWKYKRNKGNHTYYQNQP